MPKNQFVDFKAVKSAVSMEQALQHYGLLECLAEALGLGVPSGSIRLRGWMSARTS